MTDLLEIRNFKVTQPGSKKELFAVKHWDVAEGETHTLMGPSGSGKSTFLKTLARLREVSGEVRIAGDPAEKLAPEEFRSRVLYVFQQPQFIGGSVEENLRWPFRWKVHGQKKWQDSAVEEFFQHFGWSLERLASPVKKLSGGEQQLVQLLRALLLEPQFLLLDEPTSSLDEHTEALVEGWLKTWVSQGERGIIWLTHLPAQAERVATHRWQLQGGRLESLC